MAALAARSREPRGAQARLTGADLSRHRPRRVRGRGARGDRHRHQRGDQPDAAPPPRTPAAATCVAALPPGSYRITVDANGFAAPRARADARPGPGGRASTSAEVAGDRRKTSTVSGEAPVVDATHTAVSSVVGQQQIEGLPINLRNFLSFSVITPGVTNDRTPQQGASATSGLSFGGQRARSNNIMVDGLDNNDPIVGAVRATFSQEAIREFQVLTNSYSAEFGKASGGVVNIVTKSGTNELPGQRVLLLPGREPERQGPLREGGRVRQPGGPREGALQPVPVGRHAGRAHRARTGRSSSCPSSRWTSTPTTSSPSTPRRPTSCAPPASRCELGNVPYDFKTTEFLAKIDHQWSPNHNLVLRGNFADTTNENIEPFGGITARSRGRGAAPRRTGRSRPRRPTSSPPRWVNEARVQFAHEDQMIQSLDPNCRGRVRHQRRRAARRWR